MSYVSLEWQSHGENEATKKEYKLLRIGKINRTVLWSEQNIEYTPQRWSGKSINENCDKIIIATLDYIWLELLSPRTFFARLLSRLCVGLFFSLFRFILSAHWFRSHSTLGRHFANATFNDIVTSCVNYSIGIVRWPLYG